MSKVAGLHDSIEALYDFALSDVKRVGVGIPEIDDLIRGPAPGEVCMIMGRSYAGKSIIGQNIINNNRTLPSIFFSMEMPANQALIRLYSMWSGKSSIEVQNLIEQGNPPKDMWDMMIDYPKHKIVDTPGLGVEDLSMEIDIFKLEFGQAPAFVVIDYLELLGGAKTSGEGFVAMDRVATQLKDWAKMEQQRVFVLHQTNLQEKQWHPPTANSARFAGYTEADFVIGLWRPHKNPEMSYLDKMQQQHIIAANILKNRAYFEEKERIDLHIEPNLRIWRPGEVNAISN
jgi:replicative DNA helicase